MTSRKPRALEGEGGEGWLEGCVGSSFNIIVMFKLTVVREFELPLNKGYGRRMAHSG